MRNQSASPKNLAIMFSDVVGSSTLYYQLGDQEAKQKIDELLQGMIDTAMIFDGRLVKTIGDELLLFFETPEAACDAAIALNKFAEKHNAAIRTGISYGDVLIDSGDVYGNTVNNAAFLAKTAQATQILIDKKLLDNLPTRLESTCELFDLVVLKGNNENSEIFRLAWNEKKAHALDATIVSSKLMSTETESSSQLILYYAGSSMTIDTSSPPFVIGRDSANVDLFINDDHASRKHCTIYFHRGKFVLEDSSTNGCYILQADKNELYLRRESLPLINKGQISLGQANAFSSHPIRYHIF